MIFPPPCRSITLAACWHSSKTPVKHQADDRIPSCQVELHRRLTMLDAGAIDEDVEPAETFDDFIHQSAALRSIGEIGLKIGQFAAAGFNPAAQVHRRRGCCRCRPVLRRRQPVPRSSQAPARADRQLQGPRDRRGRTGCNSSIFLYLTMDSSNR